MGAWVRGAHAKAAGCVGHAGSLVWQYRVTGCDACWQKQSHPCPRGPGTTRPMNGPRKQKKSFFFSVAAEFSVNKQLSLFNGPIVTIKCSVFPLRRTQHRNHLSKTLSQDAGFRETLRDPNCVQWCSGGRSPRPGRAR